MTEDTKEPFADLPTLETPRLILRRLRREDAEDTFRNASDPRMSAHTTWLPHRTVDDSRAFIGNVLERYAHGDIAPWAVEHRPDGRCIGTCGYMAWWRHDRKAEIGYAIGAAYWGQGLMTEAVRAVIAFGFREMALHRIEARCKPANIGSARVMEKCGLRYEGTLRETVLVKGEFVDLQVYGILRREWEAGEPSQRLPPRPTAGSPRPTARF